MNRPKTTSKNMKTRSSLGHDRNRLLDTSDVSRQVSEREARGPFSQRNAWENSGHLCCELTETMEQIFPNDISVVLLILAEFV